MIHARAMLIALFRVCRQETQVRHCHPRHSGITCFKLKPVGDNRLDGTKLANTARDLVVKYKGRHFNDQVTFKLGTYFHSQIHLGTPMQESCYITSQLGGKKLAYISTTTDRPDSMRDMVVLLQSSCMLSDRHWKEVSTLLQKSSYCISGSQLCIESCMVPLPWNILVSDLLPYVEELRRS